MSSTETDLTEAENHLGKALALIHRALPRLSEGGWEAVVQNSLKGAAAHLESARQTHEKQAKPAPSLQPSSSRRDPVPLDILAVAAAAAHALFDQPHRIVSIHETGESALQWSAEGRRLIFSSHRIR